ncbi:UNKNOWN [Stylonychia lemnae]|uniref:Secreted protein n=1 Tax=Stylonychia lemnae TaxID=5949 RepID=A0A077ZWP9_STYLE|nr:UNKNOWN [Stylonychia lemnae]|eukprot:CDW74274.1 UNKNOWN [Stylonychia lemnae]
MRISAVVFGLLVSTTTVAAGDCWQDAYGRGAGNVITSCPDGQEKNGALCYPNCKDGFYGVGPVCWQHCTPGFTDTGVDCLKPSSYGRGVGYALWHESKCNEENPQGCEKWGALYYPKCKEGFHNVACCVCSPDCASGFTDIGVSCQKDSYGRGAGYPLGCAKGLEESGALCYPPCKGDYSGNGPVCWQQCPAGMHTCGALCTQSADKCTDDLKAIVSNVSTLATVITKAALGQKIDMSEIIKDAGGVAYQLADSVCDHPSLFTQ